MSEPESHALSSVKSRSPANISGPEPDIQAAIGDVRSLDAVAGLVERAKDGDKDAFGRSSGSIETPILRFARLRLGTEADDVVSEVFTRAWVTLQRYEDTGLPFVAWLYGIARHVVADDSAVSHGRNRRASTSSRSRDGLRTIGSPSSKPSTRCRPSNGRSSR